MCIILETVQKLMEFLGAYNHRNVGSDCMDLPIVSRLFFSKPVADIMP